MPIVSMVTHHCEWPPEVKSLPRVTRRVLTTERTPAEISATVRAGRVFLVDGCICSLQGSRNVDAVEMLARLLHPGVLGEAPDSAVAIAWEQAYGEAS